MITYDPQNPRHRQQMAMNLKSAWMSELSAAVSHTGQGGVPEIAPRIAAKYAALWTDAGLDPNAPGAPVAAEGVEPIEAPEAPAFNPIEYTGPSTAEIEAAMAAESRAVTGRMPELRQLHAAAKRAEKGRF